MAFNYDKLQLDGERLKKSCRNFDGLLEHSIHMTRQMGKTLTYGHYFRREALKREETALKAVLLAYGFNPEDLSGEDMRAIQERGQWIITPEDHRIGRKVFYFDKIAYIESITQFPSFTLRWLACPLIPAVATDCPK